jgi:hypothetical protein
MTGRYFSLILFGVLMAAEANEPRVLIINEKFEFAARIHRSPQSSGLDSSRALPSIGGDFVHSGANDRDRLILKSDSITIVLGEESIEFTGKDYQRAKLGMPLALSDGRSASFYLNAENKSEVTLLIYEGEGGNRSLVMLFKFSPRIGKEADKSD